MKEDLKDKEEEKWKPKLGKKYYWLGGRGGGFYGNLHKEFWSDSDLDKSLFKNNNCFKSKKEAKFVYDSFHGNF